jgi:acyl CoA:acetate/3-ketoacid CoA transferase
MVDAVVVAPHQMQATQTPYDPALAGQGRLDPATLAPIDDPVDAFLARRVARQVRRGDVCVLGYGICASVPTLLAESGELGDVSFVIEQGAVGGIPANGFRFGCAYNAAAFLDTRLAFDYLRGGSFDIALLSFLQVDRDGNVNVSLLPARPHITAGVGGFMDIVHNAPRIVFAGQLRGGGSDIAVGDGRLAFHGEGRHPKIVRAVDEITVPGHVLRRPGRAVKIVTERCTFALEPEGLTLIEIVPGTDPAAIQALCDAPFAVSPDLAVMPAEHFNPGRAPLLGPASGGTA